MVARAPALEGEIIPPGKKGALTPTRTAKGAGNGVSTALQVANAKPGFYSVAGAQGLYLKKTGLGAKDG